MTTDQAIKIYNRLEVQLWELGILFDNTGASAIHPDETREFLRAGRKLQKLIEGHISK